MKSYLTKKKFLFSISILTVLLLAAIYFGLSHGSGSVDIFEALLGGAGSDILLGARLPRVLLAAIVGMALASSGGAFQTLLKNPLADPFILGVSGGAALGSIAALGFRLPFAWISGAAFLGAMLSMIAIMWFSRVRSSFRSTELMLTGVIFNAFCFALILFINAMVTMEEAYQILFLLIGNLEEMGLGLVAITAALVIPGLIILSLLARRMNILMLGDDEARSVGVDPSRIRAAVFVCSSVMVGAAVAASGLIGFVGLFVPHIVRLTLGADNRLLIPASGIAGAAFLVLADTIARTILSNSDYATELPVGVITALIGAPLFMILLRKNMGRSHA